MHTNNSKLFNTENGTVMAPMKVFGEKEVPAGCYYDEGEVSKSLAKMLREQIYPFLDGLERRLGLELSLPSGELRMDAWMHFDQVIEGASVRDIQVLCEEQLQRRGPDQFEFFINIDFPKRNTGTQFNCLLDRLRYMDMQEIEEYPVHVLSIGRIGVEYVKVSIDDVFTSAQLKQIYQWILRDLKQKISNV